MEQIDSILIIGATSTSKIRSINDIGMIILPISAGIACTLSLGNKFLQNLFIKIYNKYKKEYENDQQTMKTLDKLCRKSSQDNVIDKNEYESLCNLFTKNDDENKIESFL